MRVDKPAAHGYDHLGTGEDPIPVLLTWKVFADTETLTVGDGAFVDAVTPDLDGCALVDAQAFVSTVSGSGLVTVQVRRIRAGVSADMLSTRVTIDAGEHTSYTAATPAVPDTAGSPARNEVLVGDLVAIDVDVAGSGAKGLGVKLTFWRQAVPGP